MQDLRSWINLNMSSLLPVEVHKLLKEFGSPSAILEASREAISKSLGINDKRARRLIDELKGKDVDKEIERITSSGIKIITYDDPSYPSRLKAIFDPPPVLYIKGSIPCDERFIAIVGSRNATIYGRSMANSLARDLARYGVTVVSGMARGVDTSAHRGAIEAGGETIAVLGSGLDIVYPAENASLMRQIASKGAVISEFPLGTKPLKQNFPRRNRIIAGLCMGVVVIEASLRSGALITANYALENGREVFALPGRVDERYSEGTNNLIKEGAKLITNVRDILEEFKDLTFCDESLDKDKKELTLDQDEAKVFECLDLKPRHLESISQELRMSIPKVMAALIGLEMKGLIKELRGKMFIRQ